MRPRHSSSSSTAKRSTSSGWWLIVKVCHYGYFLLEFNLQFKSWVKRTTFQVKTFFPFNELIQLGMFCFKCGTERKQEANYCTKCGYQFSEELIEDVKDKYQINVGVSTVVGICTGIIVGIFSAALQQTIILPWWGWAIILLGTTIFIAILINDSFKTIKKSFYNQLRRKWNINKKFRT